MPGTILENWPFIVWQTTGKTACRNPAAPQGSLTEFDARLVPVTVSMADLHCQSTYFRDNPTRFSNSGQVNSEIGNTSDMISLTPIP